MDQIGPEGYRQLASQQAADDIRAAAIKADKLESRIAALEEKIAVMESKLARLSLGF